MTFTNPIWLWGLSALTVPLAIHLLSRKEGKVIAMGSLRHLRDANTQQFKSLRLNEIVLLILRSLIIIFLVLFLSGLHAPQSAKQKWVLVESDLKNNAQAKTILDSLNKKGFEGHLLAANFPLLDQPLNDSLINYWSLIEQLNEKALSETVLISTGRAEAFRGERISWPPSLQWITVPRSPKEYLISAIRKSKDSLEVKTGLIQDGNTHYIKMNTPNGIGQKTFANENDTVKITNADTIRIAIVSDPDFDYDKKILLASLKTIQKNIAASLIISESKWQDVNAKADWLIWLSNEPAPAFGNNKIIYSSNPHQMILSPLAPGIWELTKKLNENVALQENLTWQLLKVIYPAKEIWTIADSKDQREMPESQKWTEQSGVQAGVLSPGNSPLDPYILTGLIILLIAERLVAYKRNQ
jgi:hypothetical protein